MLGGLCICALLPRLETRTRLVLFIHHSEERKPTNTGRLAADCIANSEVIVLGVPHRPPAAFACSDGSRPLFLFPDKGATPLDELAPSSQPVTLIVPDGNWRRARRVRTRVPGLPEIARVSLPPGLPSSYRLRAASHPDGLATMEAIARALGILEGPAAQAELERVFHIMVERTLWTRGLLRDADVTGGVPVGATRDGRARPHSASGPSPRPRSDRLPPR
jgi:DTW domain-containing protein YfiP